MSLCFHRNERGSFSVCGTFRVKGNAPIGTNVLLRLDFRIRISGGSADLGRESRGSGMLPGGEACSAGASPAKPEFTIYADDNARQPWDEATMYSVGFFAAAGKWCGGGRCDMLCQSNSDAANGFGGLLPLFSSMHAVIAVNSWQQVLFSAKQADRQALSGAYRRTSYSAR